ncbi:MAG: V-type ATP synthase subunit B, partial [Gammaproteobacteria bacterium]
MSIQEYRYAAAAEGGLLVVEKVPGVAFGDRVEINDATGTRRNGQVIRAGEREVLVQVFEGTEGLELEATWV